MNASPDSPQKTGKIMLVGLGPGSLGHLTARAREAIAEADTVIGYATYIRLVAGIGNRGGDRPRCLGAQHLRRHRRRAPDARLLRHLAVRPVNPWPSIARRLDAVAYADFVVALYNPKSGRRTRQIAEAQRIFLRHRDAQTPVAIVRSAYRPKQRIEFTTREKWPKQISAC